MRFLSSTRTMGSGARRVQAGVVALSICGSIQASDPDWRAIGIDQYFNHEYREAVDSFQRLVELEPGNPDGFVQLAKAQLYMESARLRLLDTSAFGDDPEFYEGAKPKPEPAANRELLATLRTGRLLCERLLQADSNDRPALHSLARIHALRAAFEIMIGKDYFRALANGRRAKGLSYRLAELHPEFVDGTLVAGLDEYMLGSLPWALRALIALSGYRGKKKKGLAMIEHVAQDGMSSRSDARVLLTLAYRRERRYLDAARELRALAREFPRAFTYPLEEAAMYKAVGELEKALEIFREVNRKRAAGEDRFDRMPVRWAEALERGIQKLSERIQAETAQDAGNRASGSAEALGNCGQGVQFGSCRAGIDRLGGERGPFRPARSCSRDPQRGPGVHDDDVPGRSLLAGKHGSKNRRVLLGAAARERPGVSRRQAEIGRFESAVAKPALMHLSEPCRAGQRDLVHAVATVHDQGAPRTQPGESLCRQGHDAILVDTDDLDGRARRVRQRPQHIEDRPHSQLPPNRSGMPHRRMHAGSEKEADPGLVDCLGALAGIEIDVHSKRVQHVGGPAPT